MVLKNLLLTLVYVGTIQFYGQQDSGKICLSYKEFDYYATKLVERNKLVMDTILMHKQLYITNNIIKYKDIQLSNCTSINNKKDSIISIHKNGYDILFEKYIGETSKNKMLKHTLISSIILTFFLGVIILVK